VKVRRLIFVKQPFGGLASNSSGVRALKAGWASAGDHDMQLRVRKAAHILERCGLALAGAACGMFVAAHVGTSVAFLTNQGFLLLMMIAGAIGFYLGIDTPKTQFDAPGASSGQIDAAEFLSAVGTFCATLSAFASVAIIILREAPHIVWTALIMLGWCGGVTMQVVAGAIARWRR
jgi:hypothetical protein